MLRGTTAALLLGLAEVNAYMISVPWLENVPRAYTIRSLGITEEADVYIRVYAPGSRGYGDRAGTHPGEIDGCSLEISPTVWNHERVQCPRHPDRCNQDQDLHNRSDVHFFAPYTCPVMGFGSLDEIVEQNDGSAISVEVWHNKLTPLQDRTFDQLLGTCKLPFEVINRYPLSESSHYDNCYVLDVNQCDSTLRSSTTFGLKICLIPDSPPPSPPPPSSPPPPPPPSPPPPSPSPPPSTPPPPSPPPPKSPPPPSPSPPPPSSPPPPPPRPPSPSPPPPLPPPPSPTPFPPPSAPPSCECDAGLMPAVPTFCVPDPNYSPSPPPMCDGQHVDDEWLTCPSPFFPHQMSTSGCSVLFNEPCWECCSDTGDAPPTPWWHMQKESTALDMKSATGTGLAPGMTMSGLPFTSLAICLAVGLMAGLMVGRKMERKTKTETTGSML